MAPLFAKKAEHCCTSFFQHESLSYPEPPHFGVAVASPFRTLPAGGLFCQSLEAAVAAVRVQPEGQVADVGESPPQVGVPSQLLGTTALKLQPLIPQVPAVARTKVQPFAVLAEDPCPTAQPQLPVAQYRSVMVPHDAAVGDVAPPVTVVSSAQLAGVTTPSESVDSAVHVHPAGHEASSVPPHVWVPVQEAVPAPVRPAHEDSVGLPLHDSATMATVSVWTQPPGQPLALVLGHDCVPLHDASVAAVQVHTLGQPPASPGLVVPPQASVPAHPPPLPAVQVQPFGQVASVVKSVHCVFVALPVHVAFASEPEVVTAAVKVQPAAHPAAVAVAAVAAFWVTAQVARVPVHVAAVARVNVQPLTLQVPAASASHLHFPAGFAAQAALVRCAVQSVVVGVPVQEPAVAAFAALNAHKVSLGQPPTAAVSVP